MKSPKIFYDTSIENRKIYEEICQEFKELVNNAVANSDFKLFKELLKEGGYFNTPKDVEFRVWDNKLVVFQSDIKSSEYYDDIDISGEGYVNIPKRIMKTFEVDEEGEYFTLNISLAELIESVKLNDYRDSKFGGRAKSYSYEITFNAKKVLEIYKSQLNGKP